MGMEAWLLPHPRGCVNFNMCGSEDVSRQGLQFSGPRHFFASHFFDAHFCHPLSEFHRMSWDLFLCLVFDELLLLAASCSFAVINCAQLDPLEVCTDASESGGGACESVRFTPGPMEAC